MIAHIVLFTPKRDMNDAEKRLFAQSVVDTTLSIGSIRSARIGRRVAIGAGYDRSMGETTYEFAAVLEFDDRMALIDYLNDPVHVELGRIFWESCERTVVSEVEYVDLGSSDVVDVLVK